MRIGCEIGCESDISSRETHPPTQKPIVFWVWCDECESSLENFFVTIIKAKLCLIPIRAGFHVHEKLW